MTLWKRYEDDDPSQLGEWSVAILERAQYMFERWFDVGPGRQLSEGTMTPDEAEVVFYADVIPSIAVGLIESWETEHIVSLLAMEPCWLTWGVDPDDLCQYLDRSGQGSDNGSANDEPRLTMIDMLGLTLEDWLFHRLEPHFRQICSLYRDIAVLDETQSQAAVGDTDAEQLEAHAHADVLAEVNRMHQEDYAAAADDRDDEPDEEVW